MFLPSITRILWMQGLEWKLTKTNRYIMNNHKIIKTINELLESTLGDEKSSAEADAIVESCVAVLRSLVSEEPDEDGQDKMEHPLEGIEMEDVTFTCLNTCSGPYCANCHSKISI